MLEWIDMGYPLPCGNSNSLVFDKNSVNIFLLVPQPNLILEIDWYMRIVFCMHDKCLGHGMDYVSLPSSIGNPTIPIMYLPIVHHSLPWIRFLWWTRWANCHIYRYRTTKHVRKAQFRWRKISYNHPPIRVSSLVRVHLIIIYTFYLIIVIFLNYVSFKFDELCMVEEPSQSPAIVQTSRSLTNSIIWSVTYAWIAGPGAAQP